MERQYNSESINELAGALAKAQGEIVNAAKSVDNTFFKSKYADLAACIDASRSALSKNGLSVVQYTDYDAADQWMVTQLMHASGQWMKSYYPIRPIKNDPQGMGSAITYARRYAYCAIVGVAAEGEDDDGNEASGRKVEKKADAPKPEKLFANAALRKAYCENCTNAYNAAETVLALNERFEMDKPKLTDMRSGDEHDQLAAEEIHKQYKLRLTVLKQDDIQKGSFNGGFTGVPNVQ